MRQRAVLAGGCFWGMQDLIRKLPGVVSTRVGYTGGDTPNATYRNHGTHAEGIEIVLDTAETSYRRILEYFFQIHDPTTPKPSGQRYRHKLPFGDLLYERRAEKGGGGDDRRRERVGPVAGQGRHRGDACQRLLGSRTGAPRLSGALSERLHLSLPSSQLGPSPAADRWQVHGNSCSCWRGYSILDDPGARERLRPDAGICGEEVSSSPSAPHDPIGTGTNRRVPFPRSRKSPIVKVFGCRPLTNDCHTHERPAFENLQGRCYGASGEDNGTIVAPANQWSAPCHSGTI